MLVYMCVCAYMYMYMYVIVNHVHSSYLTVIGVHEMHGRMHPNYCQITILLVVDPPLIIGLPYDDSLFSCSWQFAYKNFGC